MGRGNVLGGPGWIRWASISQLESIEWINNECVHIEQKYRKSEPLERRARTFIYSFSLSIYESGRVFVFLSSSSNCSNCFLTVTAGMDIDTGR